MIASRHPVMAGKFRVPILEIEFNPEILDRKQFGLLGKRPTGFRKTVLTGKITVENNLAL